MAEKSAELNKGVQLKFETMNVTPNQYGWIFFSKTTYPKGVIICAIGNISSASPVLVRYADSSSDWLVNLSHQDNSPHTAEVKLAIASPY